MYAADVVNDDVTRGGTINNCHGPGMCNYKWTACKRAENVNYISASACDMGC